MQSFRILHCLRAPVGGLFRHVCDLATEQTRLGHDVGILCDTTTSDGLTDTKLSELADVCSLGVHKTPMSRLVGHRDPLALRFATALAREGRFDVLHGHGAKGGVYARMASRINRRHGLDAHSFYTPHGGTLNYRPGSLASRIFLNVEQRLLPMTDGLCFESQFACNRFHEIVGTPRCAYAVIPNGVRPSEFTPHLPHEDAADFVFLGELRHVKGIDLLVEAIARLKSSHNATACVVGDGPFRDELVARADVLGVGENLSFPGAMPAASAFRRGRIFVLPSRNESFPYVVLEAGAQGIPALMSNVGGIAEITSPGDPFLMEADNVDVLTEAMRNALDHPDALHRRTVELTERIRTRFSTAGMAEEIVDVYRSLRTKTAIAA
ncbi:MAG: glycosyltransferase family 4 protein [Hyphomicrobiaceae bacterium]